MTRLHEGILRAETTAINGEDHRRSEEHLKLLRTIGVSAITHNTVPEVQLDFGSIWSQFLIPDRIFVRMNTAHALSDHQLQRIIDLIIHSYSRTETPPLTADYTLNAQEGSVNITLRENTVQQPEPEPFHEPQAASQAQSQEKPQDPDDGFPYDFYRGIGLIDENNYVWIPSSFSGIPMNVPHQMTDPEAKAYLLAYKPEG